MHVTTDSTTGRKRMGRPPTVKSGPPKGTEYLPSEEAIVSLNTRERLVRAKAEREEHMAALAKMEVAEREGRLIDAAQAAKSNTRAGMAIRDGVLSVPGRIAAQLVGIEDEREIERIITAALRDELTRIAHSVGSDAA